MVRVAINGFGRIGRNFLRAAHGMRTPIEVVAVNDLGDSETLANLLRFDSVLGRFPGKVSLNRQGLNVDGQMITLLSERDPRSLPWADLGIDLVVESTGVFTSKHEASMHREAGAAKVVVSAPCSDADATLVIGVNEDRYDPARHHIVSNASCTTNCLAPMAKVLDDAFRIEQGLMTTVHAYTGDQQIVDGPHRDPRRARAAGINVVPTSTGAAKAIGQVMPRLRGRLDGSALRAPVAAGSLVDLTVLLKKETDVDSINAAFRSAARSGPLRKVLEYSLDPLVSSDIVGSPMSCTFDAGLTQGSGRFFKVFGWYDNEVGYSHRLVDLVALVGKRPRMRRAS